MKKSRKATTGNRKIKTGWLSAGGQRGRSWRGAPSYPQLGFADSAKRVGEKSLRRLQWLIELVQRPREQLARDLTPEFSRERFDIAYFAGARDPRAFSPGVVLPAIEILEASCREMTSATTAVWRLKLPPIGDLTIYRDDGSTHPLFDSTDPAIALLLGADETIGAERHRIRECASPDCRRLFVKRKRGVFCSRRCTQRENMRRWREDLGKAEVNKRQRDYYGKKRTNAEVDL
jgi:hypothetical protein